MATVLSGTSGALYYKPAGTDSTFKAANVANASNSINVGTFLNFKVNDKVSFTTGTGGTLPAGLAAGTPVFILTYTASTGVATFAATAGGSELSLTNDGTDGTTPVAAEVLAEAPALSALSRLHGDRRTGVRDQDPRRIALPHLDLSQER